MTEAVAIINSQMTLFRTNLTWAICGVIGVMAVGGFLPLWLPRMRHYLPLALSMAAGIMLGTALLHLSPDAQEILGPRAGYAILSGLVFMYLFERFVTVHICEAFGCTVHSIGLAALFGLSLHTLANGVALGAGVVGGLGGVVFLAIAAHKIPETFALTAILMHEQYRPTKILWMNGLLMAMIPLGALGARVVVSGPSTHLTGWALGFSAGTFLHIALSDLLPEVHKASSHRVRTVLMFLLGLAIVTLA